MSIQVDSSNPAHALLVVNGLAIMKINQDGSVELPNAPLSTSGSRLLTANQTPFTKSYTSPEQTVTAGGTLTLAHGLGVKPKLVEAVLVCKTAEFGWSVGQEVNISTDFGNPSSYNYAIGRDETNIRAVCGTTGILSFSASGVASTLTSTNWRLIVRAWA